LNLASEVEGSEVSRNGVSAYPLSVKGIQLAHWFIFALENPKWSKRLLEIVLTYSLQLAEPLEQVDHDGRLFHAGFGTSVTRGWILVCRVQLEGSIGHRQVVCGLICKFVDWGNLSQMRSSAKKLLRDRGHVRSLIYRVEVNQLNICKGQ
jgi:hypothetical protein